jgi:hypothetical protein
MERWSSGTMERQNDKAMERWNDGAWFQILGFIYLHKAFIDCKLEMS